MRLKQITEVEDQVVTQTNADTPVASPTPSVAKSTALMSIATLGSRITGLLRTWVMAFALGNTVVTSAYQVANNMPNVIYELVAGGLLAAAFVPVYLLQKEVKDGDNGSSFASTMLNLCIVVLGILSLLATFFAPAVIATQTFTISNTAEVTQQSVFFFRIFAFQIVFYGIGGVITGILNANRVFFLPALAPALNNVVVIVSFLVYIPLAASSLELANLMLAVGTTLGVIVQFVIQIPALHKAGFVYQPKINLRDPALFEALKIALPTFLYIVGTMIAFSCRNAFSLQASSVGPSTLLYAWMWYQLPYGVVAVSLSRTMFTEMSEDFAKENMPALRGHVQSGISSTLLLIVPLAALMFVLSVPIIQIFQAGAFSAKDVAFVSYVLKSWLISLPFYSVLMYLYNVYASIRRFGMFTIVSTVGVAVQVALYAWLCQDGLFGVAGVCYADFIYYTGCCLILLIVLRKLIGAYEITEIVLNCIKVLIASVIGAALIYLLQDLLPFSDQGILGALGTIFICGIVGLAIIFSICTLFRIPQMRILNRFFAKLLKK